MINKLNLTKILNILSLKLVHYSKINCGTINRERNEIILTKNDKLYEEFYSLEITYPYYPMIPDVSEEKLTQEKKELKITNKIEKEIIELFRIIDLYICNNEVRNYAYNNNVCYLLEYNNTLYQLSYNLTESKISKLSNISIDKDADLESLIRFEDLSAFYKNQKSIKIKIKQKKD